MGKLKRCPFCGGPARESNFRGRVYCNGTASCLANVEAINAEAWNTRPIEDAQAAEIAALREQIAELKTQYTTALAALKQTEVARDAAITAICGALDELAKYKDAEAKVACSMNEALNMGDGSYRP